MEVNRTRRLSDDSAKLAGLALLDRDFQETANLGVEKTPGRAGINDRFEARAFHPTVDEGNIEHGQPMEGGALEAGVAGDRSGTDNPVCASVANRACMVRAIALQRTMGRHWSGVLMRIGSCSPDSAALSTAS